jgi:hypothetical protein
MPTTCECPACNDVPACTNCREADATDTDGLCDACATLLAADADETFPADAAADLAALCAAQRAEAIAHQEAVAAERAVA